MAHDPQRAQDLAMQTELQEPREGQEDLFSLIKRLQGKVRYANPRDVVRDVNQTVREVRAKRRLAAAPPE
jgi:hypothetical protein